MNEQHTITLSPWPQALSPNARVHWAKKAAAVKKYRESAQMLTRSACGPITKSWRSARADISVAVKDKRGLRMDLDNIIASLKAAFDGIADTGLVPNDRDIEPGTVTVSVDQQPRVTITLTRTA